MKYSLSPELRPSAVLKRGLQSPCTLGAVAMGVTSLGLGLSRVIDPRLAGALGAVGVGLLLWGYLHAYRSIKADMLLSQVERRELMSELIGSLGLRHNPDLVQRLLDPEGISPERWEKIGRAVDPQRALRAWAREQLKSVCRYRQHDLAGVRIARTLLNDLLVDQMECATGENSSAWAHLPPPSSIYAWNGTVRTARGVLLIFDEGLESREEALAHDLDLVVSLLAARIRLSSSSPHNLELDGPSLTTEDLHRAMKAAAGGNVLVPVRIQEVAQRARELDASLGARRGGQEPRVDASDALDLRFARLLARMADDSPECREALRRLCRSVMPSQVPPGILQDQVAGWLEAVLSDLDVQGLVEAVQRAMLATLLERPGEVWTSHDRYVVWSHLGEGLCSALRGRTGEYRYEQSEVLEIGWRWASEQMEHLSDFPFHLRMLAQAIALLLLEHPKLGEVTLPVRHFQQICLFVGRRPQDQAPSLVQQRLSQALRALCWPGREVPEEMGELVQHVLATFTDQITQQYPDPSGLKLPWGLWCRSLLQLTARGKLASLPGRDPENRLPSLGYWRFPDCSPFESLLQDLLFAQRNAKAFSTWLTLQVKWVECVEWVPLPDDFPWSERVPSVVDLLHSVYEGPGAADPQARTHALRLAGDLVQAVADLLDPGAGALASSDLLYSDLLYTDSVLLSLTLLEQATQENFAATGERHRSSALSKLLALFGFSAPWQRFNLSNLLLVWPARQIGSRPLAATGLLSPPAAQDRVDALTHALFALVGTLPPAERLQHGFPGFRYDLTQIQLYWQVMGRDSLALLAECWWQCRRMGAEPERAAELPRLLEELALEQPGRSEEILAPFLTRLGLDHTWHRHSFSRLAASWPFLHNPDLPLLQVGLCQAPETAEGFATLLEECSLLQTSSEGDDALAMFREGGVAEDRSSSLLRFLRALQPARASLWAELFARLYLQHASQGPLPSNWEEILAYYPWCAQDPHGQSLLTRLIQVDPSAPYLTSFVSYLESLAGAVPRRHALQSFRSLLNGIDEQGGCLKQSLLHALEQEPLLSEWDRQGVGREPSTWWDLLLLPPRFDAEREFQTCLRKELDHCTVQHFHGAPLPSTALGALYGVQPLGDLESEEALRWAHLTEAIPSLCSPHLTMQEAVSACLQTIGTITSPEQYPLGMLVCLSLLPIRAERKCIPIEQRIHTWEHLGRPLLRACNRLNTTIQKTLEAPRWDVLGRRGLAARLAPLLSQLSSKEVDELYAACSLPGVHPDMPLLGALIAIRALPSSPLEDLKEGIGIALWLQEWLHLAQLPAERAEELIGPVLKHWSTELQSIDPVLCAWKRLFFRGGGAQRREAHHASPAPVDLSRQRAVESFFQILTLWPKAAGTSRSPSPKASCSLHDASDALLLRRPLEISGVPQQESYTLQELVLHLEHTPEFLPVLTMLAELLLHGETEYGSFSASADAWLTPYLHRMGVSPSWLAQLTEQAGSLAPALVLHLLQYFEVERVQELLKECRAVPAVWYALSSEAISTPSSALWSVQRNMQMRCHLITCYTRTIGQGRPAQRWVQALELLTQEDPVAGEQMASLMASTLSKHSELRPELLAASRTPEQWAFWMTRPLGPAHFTWLLQQVRVLSPEVLQQLAQPGTSLGGILAYGAAWWDFAADLSREAVDRWLQEAPSRQSLQGCPDPIKLHQQIARIGLAGAGALGGIHARWLCGIPQLQSLWDLLERVLCEVEDPDLLAEAGRLTMQLDDLLSHNKRLQQLARRWVLPCSLEAKRRPAELRKRLERVQAWSPQDLELPRITLQGVSASWRPRLHPPRYQMQAEELLEECFAESNDLQDRFERKVCSRWSWSREDLHALPPQAQLRLFGTFLFEETQKLMGEIALWCQLPSEGMHAVAAESLSAGEVQALPPHDRAALRARCKHRYDQLVDLLREREEVDPRPVEQMRLVFGPNLLAEAGEERVEAGSWLWEAQGGESGPPLAIVDLYRAISWLLSRGAQWPPYSEQASETCLSEQARILVSWLHTVQGCVAGRRDGLSQIATSLHGNATWFRGESVPQALLQNIWRRHLECRLRSGQAGCFLEEVLARSSPQDLHVARTQHSHQVEYLHNLLGSLLYSNRELLHEEYVHCITPPLLNMDVSVRSLLHGFYQNFDVHAFIQEVLDVLYAPDEAGSYLAAKHYSALSNMLDEVDPSCYDASRDPEGAPSQVLFDEEQRLTPYGVLCLLESIGQIDRV